MTVIFWILGVVGAGFLVLLVVAARELRLAYRRKRHQWALAIGLPARIAVKERSEADRSLETRDPTFSLTLVTSEKNKEKLKSCLLQDTVGQVVVDAMVVSQLKDRIRARLTNETLRSFGNYYGHDYKVRDVIAWDAAMLVEEVRIAVTLDWMSRSEAWGLIFLNARRVQDMFEDWDDFITACMRGREFELRLKQGKRVTPAVETKVRAAFFEPGIQVASLQWNDVSVFSIADFDPTDRSQEPSFL